MTSGRYNLKMISVLVVVVTAAVSMVACAVAPANKSPQQSGTANNDELTIRYLTAPKQVQPLSSVEVSCVATDSDNSEIRYEWSATGGKIENKGDGSLILWVAPDKTGTYTVTAVATNKNGIKATKAAIIAVTSEPIQQLVVTSVKCYGCSNGIDASRFKYYDIRCEVASVDPSKLKYTWFATIGKIEGEGPNVNWYTGSQSGNALITVIITDDKGNRTEGFLAINVSCCK